MSVIDTIIVVVLIIIVIGLMVGICYMLAKFCGRDTSDNYENMV
jgi:hypothetical protein